MTKSPSVAQPISHHDIHLPYLKKLSQNPSLPGRFDRNRLSTSPTAHSGGTVTEDEVADRRQPTKSVGIFGMLLAFLYPSSGIDFMN
ncbi:hypothetical protein CsSME_00009695 [Camellia sinensis var. sinensis]